MLLQLYATSVNKIWYNTQHKLLKQQITVFSIKNDKNIIVGSLSSSICIHEKGSFI